MWEKDRSYSNLKTFCPGILNVEIVIKDLMTISTLFVIKLLISMTCDIF